MATSWSVRRYQSGDETQICALFETVFEKTMGPTESLKHWKWEYIENPVSRLEILVAADETRIVGQYSVIPVKMCVNGHYILSSLSLDTMTHSQYRGQGMFPKMATQLYEELGKTGIPITYGFPNENSIDAFLHKLSWKEIAPVPILIKPLAYMTITKALLGFNAKDKRIHGWKSGAFRRAANKAYVIEETKGFGDEFDELYEDAKKAFSVSVVRDSTYLDWRYLKKPEEKYRILTLKKENKLMGYIAIKLDIIQNIKAGVIMDLLTRSPGNGEEDYLLRSAIDVFKLEGASLVSILCFPTSPYFKKIKRLGFRKLPKGILKGGIYFGARLNSSEVKMNTIFHPNSWHLCWGDTDIF